MILFLLFLNAEFIDSLLLIYFSRLKDTAGEICVVRTVGEVLCLETESAVLAVNGTMCTYKSAVPVTAIELNTRFCGPHLQAASAIRLYAFHGV